MTTTRHHNQLIRAHNPHHVQKHLLARGCPVCGAKARQVKEHRTWESWRLHFACRAKIIGFADSVQVDQRCRQAPMSDLTEQRLALLASTSARRPR